VNASLDPEEVKYTEDTMKICSDEECSLTIFGNQRFGYEDNEWKPLESLRSYKDTTDIKCIVKKDNKDDPDAVCADWNYTSIRLSDISKSAPSKIVRKTTESFSNQEQDISLPDVRTTDLVVQIKPGDTIHLGENSTTIELQTADSENLDDTWLYELNPSTNYGLNSDMHAINYSGRESYVMLRFNISEVSGDTIDSAEISLYSSYAGDTLTMGFYELFHNYSWTESGATWNNKPDWGTEFSSSYSDTQTSGSTGWITWDVTDIVQSAIDSTEDDVNLILLTHTTVWADHSLATKEFWDSTRAPLLNITYSNSTSNSTPKSGLIPYGSGKPFYTNTSNPYNIDLDKDECNHVVWYVNATGIGTHTFFAFANKTSDMTINDVTGTVDININ